MSSEGTLSQSFNILALAGVGTRRYNRLLGVAHDIAMLELLLRHQFLEATLCRVGQLPQP
jgi:hypothetical protein